MRRRRFLYIARISVDGGVMLLWLLESAHFRSRHLILSALAP